MSLSSRSSKLYRRLGFPKMMNIWSGQSLTNSPLTESSYALRSINADTLNTNIPLEELDHSSSNTDNNPRGKQRPKPKVNRFNPFGKKTAKPKEGENKHSENTDGASSNAKESQTQGSASTTRSRDGQEKTNISDDNDRIALRTRQEKVLKDSKYIQKLEEKIRVREKECDQLKKECDELKKECDDIRQTTEAKCKEEYDKLIKEMRTDMQKKCDDDLKKMETEYEGRLEEMKTKHEKDVRQKAEAKKEYDDLKEMAEADKKNYDNRLKEMVEANDNRLKEMVEANDNNLKEMEANYKKHCTDVCEKAEARYNEEYSNRLEEMKTKYENERSQGNLSENQVIRHGTEELKAELLVTQLQPNHDYGESLQEEQIEAVLQNEKEIANLKLVTELKANESEMYRRILELEEQLRLERSLGGPDNNKVGLFEMDGANPATFFQAWLKLYDSLRKSVENMLKQNALETDKIRDWYHNLINSAIPANLIPTRLGKSVQKRIIEHCVASVLATIWEIALLGEPIVKHRPADEIFDMDMTFSELESLQSSQSKKLEIALLVKRTKSECAKLLLNRLPKPLEIEKMLKGDANFDPFSVLPTRIQKQMSKFYNQKFDAVIQALGGFGDKNTIMQLKSSIISLVYTSIHVRLQMEAMQNEIVVVFAGTTSDCRAMNISQPLDVVQLRSEQHDAITSLNPSTRSEADHAVLLTAFPGVANVKVDGGHITIDDQMENLCQVLSY